MARYCIPCQVLNFVAGCKTGEWLWSVMHTNCSKQHSNRWILFCFSFCFIGNPHTNKMPTNNFYAHNFDGRPLATITPHFDDRANFYFDLISTTDLLMGRPKTKNWASSVSWPKPISAWNNLVLGICFENIGLSKILPATLDRLIIRQEIVE